MPGTQDDNDDGTGLYGLFEKGVRALVGRDAWLPSGSRGPGCAASPVGNEACRGGVANDGDDADDGLEK